MLQKYKYDVKRGGGAESSRADDSVRPTDDAFTDERIRHLWAAVKEDEDISTQELDSLHRQLVEQQHRIERYQRTVRELDLVQAENHVHEDSVDHLELERRVKQLNKELEDTFEHLNTELHTVKENPFQFQRVRQLWLKVRALELSEKVFRSPLERLVKLPIRMGS